MYSRRRSIRLFRNPSFTGGGIGGGGGVDKIASSLTTTLTAYTNASNGAWVKINSNEYNSLQSNISNTSIAGATSNVIAAVGTESNFSASYCIFTNVVSSNTPAIPANSYLYAVQFYYSGISSASSIYANNSTTSYTNFSKIGNTLPTTTSGFNYYVLKGASNPTASSDGNLALHHMQTIPQAWFINVGGAGVRFWGLSNVTTDTFLSASYAGASAFSMQALTTTSKQW